MHIPEVGAGREKRGRGAGQQRRHKSVQVEFFLCRFFREIYPLIEKAQNPVTRRELDLLGCS